jgi:PAT family acetyl-CoA transporter-like MFS transporter 1
MLLALYAFFCRLSDPRFGGTYMALFNTFYFLGWLIPNTLVLKMIDFLTISACSTDTQNSCLTPHLKNVRLTFKYLLYVSFIVDISNFVFVINLYFL